ncbi:histidine kinase dimerization/phosphoacceptor domain -containing protein [Nitrospirota bacterium]
MKIKNKISLSIFTFGIIFFLLTTIVYIFINRTQEIEKARQISFFHLTESTEKIETHIDEQIAIAKTLANSWALKRELLKSNKMLGKLKDDARKKIISDLNVRWMETKDINDPYIQSYMTSTAAKVLNKHAETFAGTVGEVFITDYYGRVIGTTNKLTTVTHAHKYWWIESFNNAKGKVFIDDRGYDDSVGGYVLGIVVPVFEREKIIGILKINVNIDSHMKHVVSLPEETNPGEVRIVRSLGKIVYENGVEPLSTSIDERIVEEFTKKPKGTITLNVAGNRILYTYCLLPLSGGSDKIGFGGTKKSVDHRGGNVGEGWYVVNSRNYDEILGGFTNTYKLIILCGIALSILMSFLALFIGKKISTPILAISDVAREIGNGNLNAKVGIHNNDEIGELASALDTMATNLSNITASRDELNKEISERKKAEVILRASEEKHRGFLDNLNAGVIVHAPDSTIMYCNQMALDILGLSMEQMLGKSSMDPQWKFLNEDGSDMALDDFPINIVLRSESNIKDYVVGVMRPAKQDVAWVVCNSYKVLDANHKLSHYIISFFDTTKRKQIEQKLMETLDEKTILMKEVHHRVKNNLTVIQSLLSLQVKDINDDKSREYFAEAQNRVKSMAIIHEMLHDSDDITRIRTSKYIDRFVSMLFHNYKIQPNHIKLKCDIQDNIILDVETMIPLGLIINELVSNALKYAFPDDMRGELSISLKVTKDSSYELLIKDTGVGLPDDFDMKQEKSLGVRIINILTTQIYGFLEVSNNNGAEFKITFTEDTI